MPQQPQPIAFHRWPCVRVGRSVARGALMSDGSRVGRVTPPIGGERRFKFGGRFSGLERPVRGWCGSRGHPLRTLHVRRIRRGALLLAAAGATGARGLDFSGARRTASRRAYPLCPAAPVDHTIRPCSQRAHATQRITNLAAEWIRLRPVPTPSSATLRVVDAIWRASTPIPARTIRFSAFVLRSCAQALTSTSWAPAWTSRPCPWLVWPWPSPWLVWPWLAWPSPWLCRASTSQPWL